jgi:hypothetical protein
MKARQATIRKVMSGFFHSKGKEKKNTKKSTVNTETLALALRELEPEIVTSSPVVPLIYIWKS